MSVQLQILTSYNPPEPEVQQKPYNLREGGAVDKTFAMQGLQGWAQVAVRMCFAGGG